MSLSDDAEGREATGDGTIKGVTNFVQDRCFFVLSCLRGGRRYVAEGFLVGDSGAYDHGLNRRRRGFASCSFFGRVFLQEAIVEAVLFRKSRCS